MKKTKFSNNPGRTFKWIDYRVPVFLLVLFWSIAIVLWQTTGKIFYLGNFGYIGTALALGIGMYTALPRKKRWLGRRFAQILIGTYLIGFIGIIQNENIQLEGFFFYLFSGIFAGATIHYLVAKVAGPALFNRGWCGWACWTAMLLDWLPFRRNMQGRLPGRWSRLGYLHFFLSLALVLWLWFGLGYRVENHPLREIWWLVAGNALYYIIAIVLAVILKDNRAFCKYLCPIPFLQKITARFALLKISGTTDQCSNCGVCASVCPMDIRVNEYIRQGLRVHSTECIVCFECADACPSKVLDMTFKWDPQLKPAELLHERKNGCSRLSMLDDRRQNR